jgi:hypothetical protein
MDSAGMKLAGLLPPPLRGRVGEGGPSWDFRLTTNYDPHP